MITRMGKHITASILAVGLAGMAFAKPDASAPSTDPNALGASARTPCRGGAELARAALQPFVDNGQIVGAVSMTSVSGKVEVARVGVADPKTGRKFDDHTMFSIASMSKGFAGASVMVCVDRKMLSLDDPISKYIPDMAEIKVAERRDDGTTILRPPKTQMTLRMCLSHVAGFPFLLRASRRGGSCSLSLATKAAIVPDVPLQRDPMVKHQYSNIDIDLAARVVEIVARMPYEDFLEQTFFKPLGMNETTFFPSPEQLSNTIFVARVAKDKPYEDGNRDHWAKNLRTPGTRGRDRFAAGGGGLYATAGDVMKFYMMLANDGCAPDGTRILSHESIVQLSTSQYPNLDRYTLGLRQYGDWFGHDGALQTEAYANWKENRVCLLYVQITGIWNHPFKLAWRKAMGIMD